MTTTAIRYFAYGSNMLSRRLCARVPSAKALGVGKLRGYRLMWHKRSRDGSGKCDIASTADQADVVWGVVFEIPAAEKAALDLAEGLGAGYAEKEVEVTMASLELPASAYIATSTVPSLHPYDWYKAIRRRGRAEAPTSARIHRRAASSVVDTRWRLGATRGQRGRAVHAVTAHYSSR